MSFSELQELKDSFITYDCTLIEIDLKVVLNLKTKCQTNWFDYILIHPSNNLNPLLQDFNHLPRYDLYLSNKQIKLNKLIIQSIRHLSK